MFCVGSWGFYDHSIRSQRVCSQMGESDKETGVNYFYHSSGYAGGMSVLVDQDGKPIVTPIEELNALTNKVKK